MTRASAALKIPERQHGRQKSRHAFHEVACPRGVPTSNNASTSKLPYPLHAGGRCDLLFLQRTALAFAPLCRFVPAHVAVVLFCLLCFDHLMADASPNSLLREQRGRPSPALTAVAVPAARMI